VGSGAGAGYTINLPVHAGSCEPLWLALLERVVLPAAVAFEPELVLISAGFDAHVEDDMAMLRLVDADYAWVTQAIKAIADKYAEGRMVSVLEGGYNLSALARSVVAHIKVLGGL
jgi:acetoin utilization deacetylase AcuC-like enzyme